MKIVMTVELIRVGTGYPMVSCHVSLVDVGELLTKSFIEAGPSLRESASERAEVRFPTHFNPIYPSHHAKICANDGSCVGLCATLRVQLQAFRIVISPESYKDTSERHDDGYAYSQGRNKKHEFVEAEHRCGVFLGSC